MQSVRIKANQAGQRLDKFLHKILPLAGNGFLYKMLRKKNITLNGKKAEGREILIVGDEISIFFSDETFAKFSGQPLVSSVPSNDTGQEVANQESAVRPSPVRRLSLLKEYETAYQQLKGIAVLYEDANVLILNKPVGILSQKAESGDLSLNEWMIGYLLAKNPLLAEDLPTFRPSVCNRLDRNTSGIVLCGKSLAGLQYLSRCIKERTVRKFYRTICIGLLQESAQVEGYLVKDNRRNLVTVSKTPQEDSQGEKAVFIHTAYTPIAISDTYTLLEVELITGKSHQIRAHLSSIGHPLIGDYKYGSESVNISLRKKYGLTHQLLHASRVTFPEAHEGCGQVGISLSGMTIEAPSPALFRKLEKTLWK